MTDPIPPALREALDAEGPPYADVFGNVFPARNRADRARAMIAALRWVWDLPSRDVQQIKFAIAALEQEANND